MRGNGDSALHHAEEADTSAQMDVSQQGDSTLVSAPHSHLQQQQGSSQMTVQHHAEEDPYLLSLSNAYGRYEYERSKNELASLAPVQMDEDSTMSPSPVPPNSPQAPAQAQAIAGAAGILMGTTANELRLMLDPSGGVVNSGGAAAPTQSNAYCFAGMNLD